MHMLLALFTTLLLAHTPIFTSSCVVPNDQVSRLFARRKSVEDCRSAGIMLYNKRRVSAQLQPLLQRMEHVFAKHRLAAIGRYSSVPSKREKYLIVT